MSSQDKPLESNNGWDEQAVNLSENTDGTAFQNEELDSDSDDLWTDENSEFVTDIFIDESDDEDSIAFLSEDSESPPLNTSESEDELDLELSEWDFRNPLDNVTKNTTDSKVVENNSGVNKLKIDRLDNEPLETESLEALDLDAEIELEDNFEITSLDGEQLETESLEALDLDAEIELEDNFEITSLDGEQPETESLEALDLDAEIELEDNFEITSLDGEQPETESLEALDLDAEIELEDNFEITSLDGEQPETESLEALDLDAEIELEENSEITSLDGEQPETESLEAFDLDAEIELEDNFEITSLDGEQPETESLEDISSNNSFDLENIELETTENNSEWQPEISAVSKDSLNDVGFDDLDNLDNLLISESQPELLDSLDLNESLDSIELDLNLDSDSNLANLDVIVGSDGSKNSSLSPSPDIAPLKPVSQTKSTPEVDSTAKANVFDQTMRVSVRKLDNLNNLIGELIVKRNRLEDDQERLRRFLDNLLGHVQSLGDVGARMHDTYERSLLEGALIASRQSSAVASANRNRSSFLDAEEKPQQDDLDALELDRFTGFHLLSQEIIELIVRVREAASDIQFVVDESDKVTQTLRQVTSQLQEGMNSSRMVAFGLTADRLPRAVREVSRQQKKQAELHVEGKEVLIDKMIVENLYNPMTHLVNNAISHGIESPEERTKLGKPAAGNININAFIQGNQTVITVTDDGAGIDSERVKNKAVEKNLLTWAQAQNLTQPEIYDLLFHPGFSTKDKADDFAGRGVGMDVVLTDLKKIRGTVGIESQIGKGTTFTIRLPLVLSICKALICLDKNNRIAFPIDGVENTQEYSPNEIQVNANGVRCVSWQDKLLPLQPLSSLLLYNRKIRRGAIYNAKDRDENTISVIILRSVDNFLAVEVDEVQTEQEIVIKQIEGSLPKPPGIAGATVLGDGTIMPIGDVLELIEISQGKRTIQMDFNLLDRGDLGAEAKVRNEPMVLVVDDSITVRELLSMSFNKLGYRVEQARDGQEAWDKLRGGLPCNMIFCDIEMPRMNGLELLSNLQKHEDFKRLPVAMLTSRGADKHRKLAGELGAQAYLTKPYTEKDLMDVAQRLIEVNRADKKPQPVVSVTTAISESKSNGSAASSSEPGDAPLVLIIDDSVTVRELLSMTFEKAGYRVEKARDGREAWEKLKEGLPCDIAFCDIEMPRMNGLELLSQLQQDEKLCNLPIAMLTSRGAQKMRNIAAQKGAKGYFVKPYVEDSLLEAAKKMMNGEILIDRIDID